MSVYITSCTGVEQWGHCERLENQRSRKLENNNKLFRGDPIKIRTPKRFRIDLKFPEFQALLDGTGYICLS